MNGVLRGGYNMTGQTFNNRIAKRDARAKTLADGARGFRDLGVNGVRRGGSYSNAGNNKRSGYRLSQNPYSFSWADIGFP